MEKRPLVRNSPKKKKNTNSKYKLDQTDYLAGL